MDINVTPVSNYSQQAGSIEQLIKSIPASHDGDTTADTKENTTANTTANTTEIISINPTTEQEVTPAMALLDLASGIQNNIDTIGLDKVYEKTISYIDNSNKSVLLINKYLLSTGRPCIPVIAPSMAYLSLEVIEDTHIKQGDIILYSDVNGMANLGILMSAVYSKDTNKLLTTQDDLIVTDEIDSNQVKQILR